MNPSSNPLNSLADKAAAGDEIARHKLSRSLDSHLERIVRRALEKDPDSRLGRKVAAVARRLSDDAAAPRNLAGAVAENLKNVVMSRLRGGTQHLGTVTTALG